MTFPEPSCAMVVAVGAVQAIPFTLFDQCELGNIFAVAACTTGEHEVVRLVLREGNWVGRKCVGYECALPGALEVVGSPRRDSTVGHLAQADKCSEGVGVVVVACRTLSSK